MTAIPPPPRFGNQHRIYRIPKFLDDWGIDFLVVSQPTHNRTKAELKRDSLTYGQKQDVYRCPNGKGLSPKQLYRSGSGLFWKYWADKKDCGRCPLRAKCLTLQRTPMIIMPTLYIESEMQQHYG